jgi:transketolase
LCRTHIGHGSPNKHDTAGVHGSPLGPDELKLTKENLGFPADKEFYIPDEVRDYYEKNVRSLEDSYNSWQQMFEDWSKKNPEMAGDYESMIERKVADNLEEELLSVIDDTPLATRALSGKVMQKIAELFPGFTGGSADLAPSNSTALKQYGSIDKNHFDERNMHFGIREHAMGAMLSGMYLYGGIRPFGGTFLVFSDYMRPSIRLAALMGLPVVYVFTHDSIFLGEDGPTHQPVEHLAALRIIPNLEVFRPADGTEVAMAWSYALRRNDGPVALVLTRQKVPVIERDGDFKQSDINKGAYIVSKETGNNTELVIVATGSELSVAVETKKLLGNKDNVRIVSMPSADVFKKQPDEYKKNVIPEGCKVVTIEAGVTDLWSDYVPEDALNIGIDRFGASAPYQVLAEKFGFTPEQVARRIDKWE